jgi:hypothetical protein
LTIISAVAKISAAVGRDHRAGLPVDLVGGADAFAGAGFDRHLMAMGDHFPHR